MPADQIAIAPRGPVRGTIRPPGSKSITNRALICAALASGPSLLRGALDSEDTQVMVDGLRRMGVPVDFDIAKHEIRVAGCGGKFPARQADLYCANSGTTIRFLAATIALASGEFRLDGSARMRERPIGDLVDALRELQVDASAAAGGFPPVTIRSSGLRGGSAAVRGAKSSQFLSGLLMAAPYAQQEVRLEVSGELVSQPYVRITLEVMKEFGVQVGGDRLRSFVIPAPQLYQAREYAIEPDASAASYFWGAAAITGGEMTVAGLKRGALQGDVAFCDCLAQMGCVVEESADGIRVKGGQLRGVTVDMNAISDTAQTLAAVALFAEGPTTITGIAHNRLKETDRIGNLATELRKLGAQVDELPDGMRITPAALHGATIATYNDHRMAMSLALVGLRVPGVVILDPGCTAKTYPEFFQDLASLP